MSALVVDASVAAKWFFDEPHAEAARDLLRRGEALHAPDFFLLEMTNFLAKRVRRGEMTPGDAVAARRILRRLPVRRHPEAPLLENAWRISLETRRGFYDCLYLALAVALDAPLVTADRRFLAALAGRSFAGLARWVGEAE